MRYCFLLVLFIAFPSQAEYTPFGLSMGYSAAKLQGCTTLTDPRSNSIRCKTKDVPVKDHRFSEFQLAYTEAAGVCNVQATGAFDTKQDASRLRQAYFGIAAELIEALGQPKSSHGDIEGGYWMSPKDYLQKSGSKILSVGTMSWEKNDDDGIPSTISRVSLAATALDAETANLTLTVWFENNWRCFRPEISPTARVIKFNTLDLGLEQLGQGTVRLTQTEIAPEIYWIEVIDVRPSPRARFGSGAMQSQQFFSLIGTCAAWQAGKSLGRIFSFVPGKRFSGELLAFLPANVSPVTIEIKTGGSLRELTQSNIARSRQFCEELPAQLKSSMPNPTLQGTPTSGRP